MKTIFLKRPALQDARLLLLMLSLMSLAILSWVLPATTQAQTQMRSYRIEVVAKDFNYPWSICFLPDGDYLVATRVGEVFRLSEDGETRTLLEGTPETYVAGQGGYFDVVIDPYFTKHPYVYLAYAGGTRRANSTTITRAKLDAEGFVDAKVIYRAMPTKDTPQHYGGKLLFLPDYTLLLTTGDGFDYREASQDKNSQLGKVIRIHPDGSVPANNPFVGKEGDNKVYTLGHRNSQGLAMSSSGAIYLHEHGPRGGDELNLLVPGDNYGWPAVTYGINYSGAKISPYTQYPGITDPLHYWVPSIAPSGLTVYEGDMFPEWRGDLFIGALVDREVRRLDMKGGRVMAEEALFSEIGERIRDVRTGPDGSIYLLTDSSSGRVLRITR